METDAGLRFTKLRGAGQGTGPLVAEIIVAHLAEAIGLSVPERSLVRIPPAMPSLDRDGELAELLGASAGVNLGFAYLDGARALDERELAQISDDDAAAILWLDGLVMNHGERRRCIGQASRGVCRFPMEATESAARFPSRRDARRGLEASDSACLVDSTQPFAVSPPLT